MIEKIKSVFGVKGVMASLAEKACSGVVFDKRGNNFPLVTVGAISAPGIIDKNAIGGFVNVKNGALAVKFSVMFLLLFLCFFIKPVLANGAEYAPSVTVDKKCEQKTEDKAEDKNAGVEVSALKEGVDNCGGGAVHSAEKPPLWFTGMVWIGIGILAGLVFHALLMFGLILYMMISDWYTFNIDHDGENSSGFFRRFWRMNGWQKFLIVYFIVRFFGAFFLDGKQCSYTHYSTSRELFSFAVDLFVLWRAGLWKVKK